LIQRRGLDPAGAAFDLKSLFKSCRA